MHDYIVHNEKEIKGFRENYGFLSNMHECPVWFEGVLYPSSENAFMAAKTLDSFIRTQFVSLTPQEAKKLGRKITLRSDWEHVKYEVMSTIVFTKFYQNPDLRQKLIDTGDAYIEETNHWGDKIWGLCDGEGDNRLGKILMNVRRFWSDPSTRTITQYKLL